MGLDFVIEDSPRYRLTGVVGEPDPTASWKGETFDGELVDREELAAVVENHVHEGPINLSIETVPLEPPLPSSGVPETPHWAYSGFMRFRERVAATIDVDLEMMEGFFTDYRARARYFGDPVGGLGPGVFEQQMKEAKRRWESEARTWDQIDSDLVPLLHHSDCEGYLSPEDCDRVGPALRRALERMSPGAFPFPDRDVESGWGLAAVMEFCARYDRRLIFC